MIPEARTGGFLWAVLVTMLIVLLGATQGQALSCLRPNIAETFNRLQASDKVYRIAVGRIELTSTPPRYVNGKPRRARAVFRGRFLGPNGLGQPRTVAIEVQTHCVAHWCGGFPDKQERDQMVFLRRDGDGHTLDMNACPTGEMVVATPVRTEMMQDCLRRGRCSRSVIAKGEFH